VSDRRLCKKAGMDTAPTASRFCAFEVAAFNELPLLLPQPTPVPNWPLVGYEDVLSRCRSAWAALPGCAPLHFRLVGPPGVGKNQLVYALARAEGKPLYIIQGHDELMPEDLACCARLNDQNRVQYVASPLLAAMVRGGICFFDEIGKVPPRSLSLLASVLDDRRSLTSLLAGVTVHAHSEFRFCAALNDSDATGGLPAFVDERLRPCFVLDYPAIEQLMQIVAARFPAASSELLNALRKHVANDSRTSPRQALSILTYASRLHGPHEDLSPAMAAQLIAEAAAACCCGDAPELT